MTEEFPKKRVIFFFFNLFVAMSCGVQNLSSLTRDQTWAPPKSGSAESYPLDCQRSSQRVIFKCNSLLIEVNSDSKYI